MTFVTRLGAVHFTASRDAVMGTGVDGAVQLGLFSFEGWCRPRVSSGCRLRAGRNLYAQLTDLGASLVRVTARGIREHRREWR